VAGVTRRTALSRAIGQGGGVSGGLVPTRGVGGGRREERFVPRAQLAQRLAKLPMEYRKPFEDMCVSSEDTQPAIALPQSMRPPASPSRPPVPPAPPGSPTIKVDPDLERDDPTHVDGKK
jgi:hypothetical protein